MSTSVYVSLGYGWPMDKRLVSLFENRTGEDIIEGISYINPDLVALSPGGMYSDPDDLQKWLCLPKSIVAVSGDEDYAPVDMEVLADSSYLPDAQSVLADFTKLTGITLGEPSWNLFVHVG